MLIDNTVLAISASDHFYHIGGWQLLNPFAVALATMDKMLVSVLPVILTVSERE